MNDSRLRRMRDHSSGKPTLINEGCQIDGELSGSGDFIVHGKIIGDCDVNGRITLADGGIWRGLIKADDIIVAGQVEGDIVARSKVEITTTARISGTVSGDAIAVAEGAVVEGVMKTRGNSEPVEFVEKRSK